MKAVSDYKVAVRALRDWVDQKGELHLDREKTAILVRWLDAVGTVLESQERQLYLAKLPEFNEEKI